MRKARQCQDDDKYFKEDVKGPGTPGLLVTKHTLAGSSLVSAEAFTSSLFAYKITFLSEEILPTWTLW